MRLPVASIVQTSAESFSNPTGDSWYERVTGVAHGRSTLVATSSPERDTCSRSFQGVPQAGATMPSSTVPLGRLRTLHCSGVMLHTNLVRGSLHHVVPFLSLGCRPSNASEDTSQDATAGWICRITCSLLVILLWNMRCNASATARPMLLRIHSTATSPASMTKDN